MYYKFKLFLYNYCKLYKKLSDKYIFKSFLLIDVILHIHCIKEFFTSYDITFPYDKDVSFSLISMLKYRYNEIYNESLDELKDNFTILYKKGYYSKED